MKTFKTYLDEGKRGLWDNIHAKQERIKNGSGEHMRKPGSKGAPTAAALKASQNEEVVVEAKPQKTSDRYHINHPDRPATLASYKDKESAIKDRDAKYPGAKVHQVGPRGKVKAVFEEAEQIDELSKKTLGNYYQAAKQDNRANADSRKSGDSEEKKWATDRFKKRSVGMVDAKKRLSKEEAEAQFDLIEEMIEELAAVNNLDIEQVWENIKDFTDEELIEACTCWQGYKRKPGTKPCEDGSCVKEDLDESLDPSEVASNPRMYNADTAKKAYYHKKATADDKKSLEKHLDRHHGNKEWRNVKEDLDEGATADAKGYKSSTGGLTQKGRDHYNSTTGSHLKAPVTTPPSKLKKGSKAANRRKSFCARMGGMEGPMRKPNGEPTRKALALRKWNC